MTNEQLAIRIKAGIDLAENYALLYKQTCRFIHLVAWRYRAYEEVEDLEQEGYLALYDAIDGYDPDMGYKFLTYAEHWIRQRIQRYVHNNASCIRIPVHTRERITAYKRMVNSFQKDYHREPSEDEIAYYLDLGIEQVTSLKKYARMANMDSLDRLIEGTDGSQMTIGEIVQSDDNTEKSAIDKVTAEQLQHDLWGMVDSLEGRQPDVIRKRYQNGMTLEGIGGVYGVSRDAIRQTESKALRTLRKPKYSNVLNTYMSDMKIRDKALVGVGIRRFNETWTSATERIALERLEQARA